MSNTVIYRVEYRKNPHYSAADYLGYEFHGEVLDIVADAVERESVEGTESTIPVNGHAVALENVGEYVRILLDAGQTVRFLDYRVYPMNRTEVLATYAREFEDIYADDCPSECVADAAMALTTLNG